MGEEYIEAGDKTVIPGLWECHNHPYTGADGGRYMSLYSAYGVTTNVSMRDYLYPSIMDRESLAAGRRLGPRLLASGELIEGSRTSHSPVRAHATRNGLRRSLARAKALDVDFVKTYVRAPAPFMAEAARVAHFELGVPSGGHLISPGWQVGQDLTTHLQATERLTFGHGTSALSRSYEDVYGIYTDGRLDMIMTPFVAEFLFGADPGIAADPRIQELMPPWWRAVVVRLASRAPTQVQLRAVSNEIGIYATILHRGGTVVIGSDSPIEPPGVMLHVALRALARYGLTAAEALRTATALPARVWGVDDDLGTLEPGKIADLAFVDGDPFANFDDLINITHVMKAGALTSTEQIIASHPPGPASTRGAVDHERWHALGATLRNQRP